MVMDKRRVAKQLLYIASQLAGARRTAKIKYVGFPEKFWVVTDPKKQGYDEFDVEDIIFEADMARMELQFRGGLRIEQIYGFYADEKKAKKDAEALTGK